MSPWDEDTTWVMKSVVYVGWEQPRYVYTVRVTRRLHDGDPGASWHTRGAFTLLKSSCHSNVLYQYLFQSCCRQCFCSVFVMTFATISLKEIFICKLIFLLTILVRIFDDFQCGLQYLKQLLWLCGYEFKNNSKPWRLLCFILFATLFYTLLYKDYV